MYIFFIKTYSTPLENWDEAFYADTIRYMNEHHSYIVPYWNQHPFIDKPPLYYWLSLPAVRIFGDVEFSYRLVSLVPALAVCMLLWHYVYKKYGSVPAFVSVLWLISNTLFVYRTRGGNMDGLVTLLIFATYCISQSKYRYKNILFSLLLGLVFLTKATLVMYLFPVILLLCLETFRQTRSIRTCIRSFLDCVIPGVLIVGMWLTLLGLQEGISAVRYFLLSADQGVAHLGFTSLSSMYVSFLQESASKIFFGLSLVGFLAMLYKPTRSLYELYYALALLILLSMSPVHNNWYLLPVMPFWALSAGVGVYALIDFVRRLKRTPLLGHFVTGGIICMVLLQHARIVHRSINYIIHPERNVAIRTISRYVQKHVPHDAQLVRLDANYTATAFYAQRFTMSSSRGDASRNFFLIPRDKLTILVTKPDSKFALVAETTEVQTFIESFPQFHISYTTGDQSLAQNY